MKERIAAFVKEQAYRPLTAAELAEALNVPPAQRERFDRALAELETQGLVIQTRAGRYGVPERMNLAVGRVQGHPRGFGFLIPDEKGTDVFLGKESLNGAMHGDRVVVRLTATSREGRPEGEVIRILTRAHQRVVGNYEQAKWGGFVTPDDRRIPEDIMVPKGLSAGARPGEKVVLLITRYPDGRKPPEGRIVERLGRADDPDVEVQGLIRKHNLPENFPQKVLRDAEAIELEIQPEELEGRRDLRGEMIVTIDGADAKDLDDAISVRRLANGNWELGVHIADVSHYVRENSALDREAYNRGTSVYFPERVIPMLPARLSNGICSLHPYEDRLTLSCTMEINDAGRVVRHDMYASVIRSVERLTYNEVSDLLENQPGSVTDKLAPLEPMLREAGHLAEVLRRKRENRGALDFDLPEAKLIMGDEGVPSEIYKAERRVANRLIEEFMLAANETVAEHVARMEVPFVYRIHETPSEDKISGLVEFLGLFDYRLRLPKGGTHPKNLQEVTAWAHGRPDEGLINTVLLRSMKQAKYAPTNEGHFGLAAEFYCHFTSPIRRYPDLIVHRVLREILVGRLANKRRQRLEIITAEAALQSSDRERAAVEAEREVEDLLKCRFMLDKLAEDFDGVISSVTPFGFFVQLPSTVEGLVHISTLDDDYYHFEERIYALVGERTRRRYRLGDTVRVKVARVDTAARQIDFALLNAATSFEEPQAKEPAQRQQVAVRGGLPRQGASVKRSEPKAPSWSAVTPDDDAEVVETTSRGRQGRLNKRGASSEALELPTGGTTSSKSQSVRPGRQPVLRERGPRRVEPALREEEPHEGRTIRRTPAPRIERAPRDVVRMDTFRSAESTPAVNPGLPGQTDMWGVPMKGRPTARPVTAEMRREETGSSQAPWSLPAQADRSGGGRRDRSRGEGRSAGVEPLAGTPSPATSDEAVLTPNPTSPQSTRQSSRSLRRPPGRRRPRSQQPTTDGES